MNYVFIGVGSGGTISGTARKLKELDPNIKVVGVDPIGSVIADPPEEQVSKEYFLEGLGDDVSVPESVDKSVIDFWVKTNDAESFKFARELAKKEGMLCGGSSGAVVAGMIKFLKSHKLQNDKNIRCVAIFPDSIRNYLDKFISDEWMVKKGFMPISSLVQEGHPLRGKSAADLQLRELPTLDASTTIQEILSEMKKGQTAVVMTRDNKLEGIITCKSLLEGLKSGKFTKEDPTTKAISKEVTLLELSTDLSAIDALLKSEDAVFVSKDLDSSKLSPIFAITKSDLLQIFD